MSDPNGSAGRPNATPEQDSVLAKLPRTRPQRSSPRRAAARARKPGAAADAELLVSTPAAANGHAPSPGAAGKRTRRATVAPSSAARGSTGTRAAGTGTRASGPRPARRAPTPAPAPAPAPRQGFECEGERASRTVQPPGGAELVSSAAEIAVEFAKAGLSAGERLLKDAFSRLPF